VAENALKSISAESSPQTPLRTLTSQLILKRPLKKEEERPDTLVDVISALTT